MKKCAMCFVDKEVTEFNVSNRKYGDGRSSYCKPCQSAYYKAYNAARTAAHKKYDRKSKVCRDCGLEKPISQFGKRQLSPDKHNIYCKPCWRDRCKIASRKHNRGQKI
jgi:RNase P subunit RPR2